MAIAVQLNAVFNIDSTTYTANMIIPATAPTGPDPFLFKVVSAPAATPSQTTPLLTVAVGATNEVYVAIAPPTDLLDSVAGDGFIQTLEVKAAEGDFDPGAGKFKASSTPSPAA